MGHLASVAGLISAGLFAGEAKGMVETCRDSYFDQDGLRVFWVVPAANTEASLPLEVSPRPEKSVRVIVGRSEVLRPARERQWLSLSQNADHLRRKSWSDFCARDRFGLAYRQRIGALAATAGGE